jgi:hypothetical protein
MPRYEAARLLKVTCCSVCLRGFPFTFHCVRACCAFHNPPKMNGVVRVNYSLSSRDTAGTSGWWALEESNLPSLR